MARLKLAKLPERTPVRLTIALPPELHRTLEAYAAAYRETYGETEKTAELIPFMLEAFLESDRNFARFYRARGAGEATTNREPLAVPSIHKE